MRREWTTYYFTTAIIFGESRSIGSFVDEIHGTGVLIRPLDVADVHVSKRRTWSPIIGDCLSSDEYERRKH